MRREGTRWSDRRPFISMFVALSVAALVAALVTAGDQLDGSAGALLRSLGVVVAVAGIAVVLRVPGHLHALVRAARGTGRR